MISPKRRLVADGEQFGFEQPEVIAFPIPPPTEHLDTRADPLRSRAERQSRPDGGGRAGLSRSGHLLTTKAIDEPTKG